MALVSNPFSLKRHLDLPHDLDQSLPLLKKCRKLDLRPLNLNLIVPNPVSPLCTVKTLTREEASQTEDGLSQYEKFHQLGHGNGGVVYKVRHKATQSVYALKTVRNKGDDNNINLARELEILRCTKSPYVVECHEIFEMPSGDAAVVMEYMDNGTVDSYVKNITTINGKLESVIASIARQLLKGLQYLKSQNIVHRDIKPANILINRKKEVKIADFGVSKILTENDMGLQGSDSYVGTVAYMSPERHDSDSFGSDDDCGYAGDIWSLGVSLMELYMGRYPYLEPDQKPDMATITFEVCFGDPPRLPEDASESFRDFIQCCLQKKVGERWTMEQLLSHPFVKDSSEVIIIE